MTIIYWNDQAMSRQERGEVSMSVIKPSFLQEKYKCPFERIRHAIFIIKLFTIKELQTSKKMEKRIVNVFDLFLDFIWWVEKWHKTVTLKATSKVNISTPFLSRPEEKQLPE